MTLDCLALGIMLPVLRAIVLDFMHGDTAEPRCTASLLVVATVITWLVARPSEAAPAIAAANRASGTSGT